MNRKPLGSPVRADMRRNCLLCTRWVACRDPSKDSQPYACSKFSTEFDMNLAEVFEKEDAESMAVSTAHVKTDSGLLVPAYAANRKNFPIVASNYNLDINVADEEDAKAKNTSLSDIISKVLNSGVPVPPDLRIDDQQIERPKNIVEWITDDRFIGGEDKPFGKQVQVMAHTMGEWCPRCSDEDYFENVPVKHRYENIRERVVFLENGRCPCCKRTKLDLMEDYDLKDPEELIAIMGQRSGKTISATMIESYNLARWLMTPNIPATYNIKASTIISFTYTATTFNQVRENFWMPYDTLINGSEWYRKYHRFLDELGDKYGEELYKHSETILAYRHKNLFSSCASPSMRSLRGRTRGGAGIDEYGWMKSGKTKSGQTSEMMNGPEVHTALKRSLTTLRSAYNRLLERGYYNAAKPLMTCISSPSARNDPIMSRFREVQGSKKIYYCIYPTWEVNPDVPRKDLDEDFRTRPVESARDFGCEPPMALNPWIGDEALVESSFTGGSNLVSTKARRYRTKSKKLVTSAHYTPRSKLRSEYGGIMGIDAGWNNNSFAIAIAYPTTVPDVEDEDEEDIFVGIEIPLLVEIIPRKDYPISFTGIYNEIIKPLCEQYNVVAVVSDRWQNKKIMSDLEDALDIETLEYKLTLNDFNDYRQCLYDELIVHPKLDMPMDQVVNMPLDNYPECFSKNPVGHLAFQMLTVQDAGNAIVKGEDGTTDDILRACVIAHTALQDEETLELSLSFSGEQEKPPALATMMAYSSSSRGSAGATTSMGSVVSRGSVSGRSGSSSVGVIGSRR